MIFKYKEYIKENVQNEIVDNFISKIREDCDRNDVKLILSDTTHVLYPVGNVLVNGYFVKYPQLTLAVAMKKPQQQWLSILVHESSHMDQCLENCKEWRESFIGEKETTDYIDEWIGGKEFTKDELDFFIKSTRNCELDCEKRSAEKIKEYNLPIDVYWYIKKSNAYIYFHNFIRKYRKWYIPGKEPYNIKEIVDIMPSTYDNDYTKLPMNMEEAYLKYCFNNDL